MKRNRKTGEGGTRKGEKGRGGGEGEKWRRREREEKGKTREKGRTIIPTGRGDRNGDFEDIKKLTILSPLHTQVHVGASNTNISHLRIKH